MTIKRVSESHEHLKMFLEKVRSKKAVAGIVGLGYVGLPLTQLFVDKGYKVLGFDIDPVKVNALMKGRSYIEHIPAKGIARMVRSGMFEATTDFSRIGEVDAVSICVPTPLDKMREPDLTAVSETCKSIAPNLRPGQLIILESTTFPGTTQEVMVPILERSGLKAGRDFFAAFSPEREDPGNPKFSARNIPKVVGANDAASRAALEALYGAVFTQIVPVSSCEAAEMSKLLENIYRCVNIAMVNELKLLCQRMGINIWEVIEAAKTKPFGFQAFYPGPGLGGHCIPIDPYYLSWKARAYDFTTRFIELAGEINTSMPYSVVERAVRVLNDRGVKVKGARILVLGVAYKKNVDDIRESPALKVIELLDERGLKVTYHDPHVPHFRSERHGELKASPLPKLTDAALRAADAVMILTDHDAFDYPRIVKVACCVIDTRNATKAVTKGREKIVLA
ncbi:MAG: nucleotide sugar dehydrogenase [Candidatus Sumerlaeota bacterium]|nr:nucleotide sugar dehydrogenase [Candidatus Sumerlaeota bacterium]